MRRIPIKKWWLAVVIVLVIGGLFADRYLRKRSRLISLDDPIKGARTTAELWAKKGEKGLKARYYAPQIAVYEKLVRQYPENLDLQKKLAAAYFGFGEYAKAEPLLEALKTRGADAEIHYELAAIAFQKGELAKAKENLNRALAFDPQHAKSNELAVKLQ